MKVVLLPERKELSLTGARRVGALLRELGMLPGTVMVIRNDELLTEDERVADDDYVEIRRVISGGI